MLRCRCAADYLLEILPLHLPESVAQLDIRQRGAQKGIRRACRRSSDLVERKRQRSPGVAGEQLGLHLLGIGTLTFVDRQC